MARGHGSRWQSQTPGWVDGAAGCLSRPPGTTARPSPAVRGPAASRSSAMRGLWPLAVTLAVVLAAGMGRVCGGAPLVPSGPSAGAPEQQSRAKRGAEDEEAPALQPHMPEDRAGFPRPLRPAGPQPAKPSAAGPAPGEDRGAQGGGPQQRGNLTGPPGQRLQVRNPLYPLAEDSYGAYAVMLLALVLFAVGIVANLAVMCVVWHSYRLKSAWNAILAGLALWDFLVLFFCLPVVIFNAIAKRRLLGDVSCRAVPFVEVSVRRARAQGARGRPASAPTRAGRSARSWVQVALGGGGPGRSQGRRALGPLSSLPLGQLRPGSPPLCAPAAPALPHSACAPQKPRSLCVFFAATAAAGTRSSRPRPQHPASRSGVCRETPAPRSCRPPIDPRPIPANATSEGRARSHCDRHRCRLTASPS